MTFFSFVIVTVKEHYTGNKTRNAQVREDVPRARVEQELEALRYQTYIQQQLVTWFARLFKNSYFLFMYDTLIFYEILCFFFFVKRGERRTCCQTDRTFSGTRGTTKRTGTARADEIATEIGRWSYAAGNREADAGGKGWGGCLNLDTNIFVYLKKK